MSAVCRRMGMTRQNYYAKRRRREAARIETGLVAELARRERESQPRIGGRKLLALLKGGLEEAGLKMGRDRFFAALRQEGLLLRPLRAWAPRTTDSRHALPVFTNLASGMETDGPNQVWVADLTYLRTRKGFVYLSLIMDRHSRKIVGWHCGETLEAVGCVRSLEMALASLPAGAAPVHHSDRGCQYACREYVELLRGRGLAVSMTGELHCYENAHAERLNGILKQEYGLGMTFLDRRQAVAAVGQAVSLYNHRRPHEALAYRTPAEVHAA